MRIGLIDVDGNHKNKQYGSKGYPNLALCKIAAHHRSIGDSVEWATIFDHYDIIYKSKIFNFTEDDTLPYDADMIIKGGTGYDATTKLPDYIDRLQPDLSIYPSIPDDTSYGFLTRGCPNKCKWCVVPIKEGPVVPYMDIDYVANGNMNIVLMDNNILADGEYAKMQMRKIIERGYNVDFNQAIDARLVTAEFAQLLAKIKWIDNRIRFGCDTPGQIKWCERAMDMINAAGYKGEYFMYTMLTDDMQECYSRLMYWWRRNKEMRLQKQKQQAYPYAQPYRDPQRKNTPPQWQKDMAGWCNKKMIFTTMPFEDYEPRKGFNCGEQYLGIKKAKQDTGYDKNQLELF